MAGMEALGRLFNVVPVADAVEVDMQHATGVTFVCVGANAETFTVKEARDAAGTGAQNLACVTHYYANAGSSGANAWTRSPASGENAATAVVTTTTAAPVAAIFVGAAQLSDGFTHVRVDSSSTGTVFAILHDLRVKRTPENLPAVAV